MFALHPRVLAGNYPAVFAFYAAVLPELTGYVLARGDAVSGYASWDAPEGATAFAVIKRDAFAGEVPPAPAAGGATLVVPVADAAAMDAAVALCRRNGGVLVAPARDLPGWGLRAAHLRDPDGNLLEIQTY
ncbi:glyoxalase/bleomycin resistance/extradiol dioxygenase family protein (plasmid) [Streptomyces sp. NBC_00984]|uniref:glyoxalase/bleomycin resistance/extradiol dioxygenase family protein n=1 Tax=Streptomyces sp. NBC_00984 TaxID=2903700 RepID=UPI003864A235|nr:glyoxalase/bleomycin resistance/extradiol dioxygenase family protein [Streptomyces sp. NBC_00984]